MSIEERIRIIKRNKIEDSRGWFLKVINGLEEDLPSKTGEIYITNAKIGEIKGVHYHDLANEWFTLLFGVCELKLVDIKTNEKLILILDENNPTTVFVPSGIAHAFVNTGDAEFTLLAYSDQLFDPKDTIPFSNF